MKKKLQTIIFAIICGVIIYGCGSESGGSGKIKKNEYLGSLPAIYNEYETSLIEAEAKLNKKAEELMKGGEKNYAKLEEMSKEYEVAQKTIKDKFRTNLKAEIEKLVGKEIPVLYNDTLKNSDELYYNVQSIKTIDDGGELGYTVTIVAKEDFIVPAMKSYDYTIYYRLLGDKGTVISHTTTSIIPVTLSQKSVEFSKGEVITEQNRRFQYSNNVTEFAGFSGIEFISKEQYKKSMGL